MKDFIILKSQLLQTARSFLCQNGFYEVNTPTLRKGTNQVFPRQEVKIDSTSLSGVAYLRDALEWPLRSALQYVDKVFELGVCYRMEKPDETHNPEFLMLTVYVANQNLSFMIEFAEHFLSNLMDRKLNFHKISIRDFIFEDLGIDVAVVDNITLKKAMLNSDKGYSVFSEKPLYEVINRYISDKIESQTINFEFSYLTDYPVCTLSTAKRKNKSNIISRFELFYKGMEIANGYEDETDLTDKTNRSQSVNLFNYEEQIITQLLENNLQEGVLVGFGFDRLCMVISNSNHINNHLTSKEFSFLTK